MVVYCLLAKISCAALPRPRRSCQRGPAAGGGAGPPPGPGAAARAAPAAVGAPAPGRSVGEGTGAAAPGSAGAASRQPRAAGSDAVRPPAKHCVLNGSREMGLAGLGDFERGMRAGAGGKRADSSFTANWVRYIGSETHVTSDGFVSGWYQYWGT